MRVGVDSPPLSSAAYALFPSFSVVCWQRCLAVTFSPYESEQFNMTWGCKFEHVVGSIKCSLVKETVECWKQPLSFSGGLFFSLFLTWATSGACCSTADLWYNCDPSWAFKALQLDPVWLQGGVTVQITNITLYNNGWNTKWRYLNYFMWKESVNTKRSGIWGAVKETYNLYACVLLSGLFSNNTFYLRNSLYVLRAKILRYL